MFTGSFGNENCPHDITPHSDSPDLFGWGSILNRGDPHAWVVVTLVLGFVGPWCNEGKMADSHMKKGLLWEQHSQIYKQEAPRAHFTMTLFNLLMACKYCFRQELKEKSANCCLFYFFNFSVLLRHVNNQIQNKTISERFSSFRKYTYLLSFRQ